MKIKLILLTAVATFGLVGCGAPANNAPATSTAANANTAKPVAAAPTADALLAVEKAGTEAFIKGDAEAFAPMLSDKYGDTEGGKHNTKADVMKRMTEMKCDFKEWKFDEPQISKIDDDTYVLGYKATWDGSCTVNGKTEKMPNLMRGASVYVRSGDKWQAAWSGLMPMMDHSKDEKGADKKADAKKDDSLKAEREKNLADAKKADAAKKDAPKKDEAPKPGMNKTSLPPMQPDANTDALVKIETAGWMAWKDKDAKALDSFAAKNLADVDPMGMWYGTRAEVLKSWDGSNCSGITKVEIKNGFAWALSPTVEILTFDADTNGMCDGMKNGPLNGTSVYVKEGDAWKIAFGYTQPAGKM